MHYPEKVILYLKKQPKTWLVQWHCMLVSQINRERIEEKKKKIAEPFEDALLGKHCTRAIPIGLKLSCIWQDRVGIAKYYLAIPLLSCPSLT